MEHLPLNFILVANILKSGYFIVQTQVSVTLKTGQSVYGAFTPPDSSWLPLFLGMRPSHHLIMSPVMILHLTPDLRTQLPAQYLTLTMNPVELDLPHKPAFHPGAHT